MSRLGSSSRNPAFGCLFRHWRLARGRSQLFSTITSLATPQDVTLQQLRIECFHPADSATEEIAAGLGAKEHGGRRRAATVVLAAKVPAAARAPRR